MKKVWTDEDVAYLEENWGKLSMAVLMKKLGASRRQIGFEATALGLGRWLDSCEFITLAQFAQAIGVDRRLCERRLIAMNFPIEHKQFDKVSYKLIDVDAFWKWAELHQDVFSFRDFPRGALGKEPAWVDVKRRANIRNHTKGNSEWSSTDEVLLKSMLKANRYTYADISDRLQRTELSIKKHIETLGLTERPIRKPRRPWTREEDETIKTMRSNHCPYGEIGKVLNRSEQQIRGRVERTFNPAFHGKQTEDALHTRAWHRVSIADFMTPKPVKAKKKRTSKKKM